MEEGKAILDHIKMLENQQRTNRDEIVKIQSAIDHQQIIINILKMRLTDLETIEA